MGKVIAVVLVLGLAGGGFYYYQSGHKKEVKELGEKVGSKAKELGKDASKIGKDIGKKAKEVGKDIKDGSKVAAKKIGEKGSDLKDKAGNLLNKGKKGAVKGYEKAKDAVDDISASKKCPSAFENLRACYPQKLKGVSKTKAVSKCSVALISGNVEFKGGLNCLARAGDDCAKVKKCIDPETLKRLLAQLK